MKNEAPHDQGYSEFMGKIICLIKFSSIIWGEKTPDLNYFGPQYSAHGLDSVIKFEYVTEMC